MGFEYQLIRSAEYANGTGRHLTEDKKSRDEREIVLGLRSEDPSAWHALCDQFGDRIWTFIVRLVGNDESVVCDVFQETFLAASRSGRNLDAEHTKLWAWLSRIAHNQVANYWRQVYRNPQRLEPPDVPADPILGPETVFSGKEMAELVRRVLAEMGSDYVTLLTAKYINDQSVAQIVNENGGTTESVRSRLARARRDFKLRFERLSANQTEQSFLKGS